MTVDELFDAWERAWSGRDPSAFAPLCADDFAYEDPLTPEPLQGASALVAHVRTLWEAFPDARAEPTAPALQRGGNACIPWRMAGTHKGSMAMLPATDRFVTLQTADRNPSKPHPAMALAAMAEAGASPDATVFIGDTGWDMGCARAAGCGAIGVGWGYHDHDEMIAMGAHGVADTPGEVAGHASNWVKRA